MLAGVESFDSPLIVKAVRQLGTRLCAQHSDWRAIAMKTHRDVHGINSWIVEKLCKIDATSQKVGFNGLRASNSR